MIDGQQPRCIQQHVQPGPLLAAITPPSASAAPKSGIWLVNQRSAPGLFSASQGENSLFARRFQCKLTPAHPGRSGASRPRSGLRYGAVISGMDMHDADSACPRSGDYRVERDGLIRRNCLAGQSDLARLPPFGQALGWRRSLPAVHRPGCAPGRGVEYQAEVAGS